MIIVGVIVLAVLVIADRSGRLYAPRHDDERYFQGRMARVEAVISGDTIEVNLPDPIRGTDRTRIRLWGVTAPNFGFRDGVSEPFAAEARAFVRDRAEGETVRLHIEHDRVRDNLGRLLAHIELPDGEMLNRLLLMEGLARVDERWPHARLTQYAAAERMARRQDRGIWSRPRLEE